MRRFELGMSLDYVENWTSDKAINEIFQNALDESIQNPENEWYFNYNKDEKILKIGNKLSKLPTKSLLLGSSTKRGDSSTIGQHGEGYKVATIVLLRSGCGVKVYNYNEKEIWVAKVVKSRRYDANIGVFDVQKMGVFSFVPEHSLIFEISNVTEELYESVKAKNLWLQDDIGKTLKSDLGRVLLDNRFKGKVFVKGLYVCDKSQLNYGYDLAPSLVSLDRDRGLVDSFNLQIQLGKLLISLDDYDFIYKVKDLWDGHYIRFNTYGNYDKMAVLCDMVYDDFKKEYGEDAVPVSCTEDFNKLKRKGYNAVMVNENNYYYITGSSNFSPVDTDECSLSNDLVSWFESIKEYLPDYLRSEGEEIINDIVNVLQ